MASVEIDPAIDELPAFCDSWVFLQPVVFVFELTPLLIDVEDLGSLTMLGSSFFLYQVLAVLTSLLFA